MILTCQVNKVEFQILLKRISTYANRKDGDWKGILYYTIKKEIKYVS